MEAVALLEGPAGFAVEGNSYSMGTEVVSGRRRGRAKSGAVEVLSMSSGCNWEREGQQDQGKPKKNGKLEEETKLELKVRLWR